MPRGININYNVTDDELLHLHWEKEMTMLEIAKYLGYSITQSGTSGIYQLFKRRGLPHRSQSEVMKLRFKKNPDSFFLHKNRRFGEKGIHWKGGRRKDSMGYIKIMKPEYPRADSHGYVLEHIIAWEEFHKRPLPKGWVIHHLNGIKDDNRPENLMALPRNSHTHGINANREYIKGLQSRIRELEQNLPF